MLLREVSGMICSLSLPGAGPSERFDLERGGKQGGVETPEEFNIMLEAAPEDVVSRRDLFGHGFALDDDDSRITHLIWADNLSSRPALGSSELWYRM